MTKHFPPTTPEQALKQAVARLPASARRKYRTFLSQQADAAAAVRAAFEREQLAEAHFVDLQRRLGAYDHSDPMMAGEIELLSDETREAEDDFAAGGIAHQFGASNTN